MKFNNPTDDKTPITATGHAGHQHETVEGWENGTTGVGGDVSIRLGHTQGVQSLDANTVGTLEPLRLGRFIGFWLRKPPFFNSVVNKYFDYFFQDRILEVSGLADNQIGLLERKGGPVSRNEAYAGYYVENNAKFTIKVNEVKGSPIRKIMKYYITGMSDNQTGHNHFHDVTTNLRFNKINYSGDFLYALLGPTMKPDDIEFACVWFYAFPSVDFIGHLNSGAIGADGDAANEKEIEFNGIYASNSKVIKLAKIIVEALGLYKDTNEDIILPSYIDEKYFSNDVAALASDYGVDLQTKLTRALGQTDAAAVLTQATSE